VPRPDKDPRVTDLARYRRARNRARKPRPAPDKPPDNALLGSRPRAGLILVAVVVILTLLYFTPKFM
jgi:hypothetical protein